MLTKIRDYIRKNYTPDGYDDAPDVTADFPTIAKYILKTMHTEKQYCRYTTEYERFKDWCQGLPSILDTCYFYNRSACADLEFICGRQMTDERQAEKAVTWVIYKALCEGRRE